MKEQQQKKEKREREELRQQQKKNYKADHAGAVDQGGVVVGVDEQDVAFTGGSTSPSSSSCHTSSKKETEGKNTELETPPID